MLCWLRGEEAERRPHGRADLCSLTDTGPEGMAWRVGKGQAGCQENLIPVSDELKAPKLGKSLAVPPCSLKLRLPLPVPNRVV